MAQTESSRHSRGQAASPVKLSLSYEALSMHGQPLMAACCWSPDSCSGTDIAAADRRCACGPRPVSRAQLLTRPDMLPLMLPHI